MTDDEQKIAQAQRLANKVKQLGYFILALGLAAALAVYLFTHLSSGGPGAADGYQNLDGSTYAMESTESRSYQYNLERIGGKSMLFAAEFNDWFTSLWQLKKLPVTLTVFAIVLASLCFLLAHFLAFPRLDDEDDDDPRWRG
jgi:hypothetical protein